MPAQFLVKGFLAASDVKFTVKGFTIMKGESSSGKSSSLKAIYAACTNTFSRSQIRWGEKQAVIKMRLGKSDPILTISKEKNGSPIMLFGDREYSKMSRSVPKEVADYINIGFIQVGSDKYCLNFFTQFQPPLLHVFSQRRIAEILSSSTALEEFNLLNKEISARREQLRGSFNHLDSLMTSIKERMSDTKAKIDSERNFQEELSVVYPKFLSADSVLDTLRAMSEMVCSRRILSGSLKVKESLKDTLGVMSGVTSDLESLLGLSEDVRMFGMRGEVLNKSIELSKVLEELENVQDCLDTAISLKEDSPKVTKVSYHKCLMEEKLKVLMDIESVQDEISNVVNVLNACRTILTDSQYFGVIRSRVKDNKELLKSGVCPYCGSKQCNENMNKEEIQRKRKELEEQIRQDEKDLAILESRIGENAKALGIPPTYEAISNLMKQKEEEKATLEAKVTELLDEIDLVRSGKGQTEYREDTSNVSDIPEQPVDQKESPSVPQGCGYENEDFEDDELE